MFAYIVVFLVAFLVVGCLHLMRTNPRELVPGAWATSTPVLLVKAAVCACARPQGVLSEEWKVEPEAEGRRSATGNVKIPDDKLEALSTTEEKWRYGNTSLSCSYPPLLYYLHTVIQHIHSIEARVMHNCLIWLHYRQNYTDTNPWSRSSYIKVVVDFSNGLLNTW